MYVPLPPLKLFVTNINDEDFFYLETIAFENRKSSSFGTRKIPTILGVK